MIWPLLLAACDGDNPAVKDVHEPPAVPGPAPLRRLTDTQYRSAIATLIGPDVPIGNLEPDVAFDGFLSVGAGISTLSSLGVEQYETAAIDAAGFAVDEAHRTKVVPCTPAATIDDACATKALEPFARQAWRRPATEAELGTLVDIAGQGADTLGDFHLGLAWGLTAVLQSPNFLYRAEFPGPDGRTFDDFSMASRLAFLLWSDLPDNELLDAAEEGLLTTDAGVAEQVDRMLADPKAVHGLRNFFDELFELVQLEDLTQDPTLYPHMGEDVGPAAREETLIFLSWWVTSGNDWRDIVTTNETFVDRKIASIYQIPAPEREGFGHVLLAEEGGRRGLLGHASFLALNAHPTSTSATLRGKYVRNKLLCQDIPPPPADVDTSIPPASGEAPTLRDRVAEHLSDPFCAGCHELTDPIGLALENFDALGAWRPTDGGYTIDASGDLDGIAFADAWELGDAVRAHEDFATCIVEQVATYGLGRSPLNQEDPTIDWLEGRFPADDHDVTELFRRFATSEAFRTVGEDLP